MLKRLICLSALFTVLLYLILPAQAVQQITSTLQVPLFGTVFVPLSDGSFDSVYLSGRANVVTTVPLSDIPPNPIRPVRIHVNLDQVSGMGSITKKKYIAAGTDRIYLPTFPTGSIHLSFDLLFPSDSVLPIYPDDPIMPLHISFSLAFTPDTDELSHVNIESISLPSISTPEHDLSLIF